MRAIRVFRVKWVKESPLNTLFPQNTYVINIIPGQNVTRLKVGKREEYILPLLSTKTAKEYNVSLSLAYPMLNPSEW